MPFSFLCVWYAYILLWDTDFFYKVRRVRSKGLGQEPCWAGMQDSLRPSRLPGQADPSRHQSLLACLSIQADPTPNILRTHATSYTELGIGMGYFISDFIICVKYNVRQHCRMGTHT